MRGVLNSGVATTTWALLTAALFLVPATDRTPRLSWEIPGLDKLVHFTLFFVLAGLAFRSFAAARRAAPERLAAVATIVYSLLLEIAQRLVPGRESTWTDALANVLGATCAAALCGLWRRRR